MKSSLDVTTIRAGIAGDPDAISTILKHYEGFITKHATVPWFDEYGNVRRYLDEDIKAKLQHDLVMAIQRFDIEGCLKNGP